MENRNAFLETNSNTAMNLQWRRSVQHWVILLSINRSGEKNTRTQSKQISAPSPFLLFSAIKKNICVALYLPDFVA